MGSGDDPRGGGKPLPLMSLVPHPTPELLWYRPEGSGKLSRLDVHTAILTAYLRGGKEAKNGKECVEWTENSCDGQGMGR